MAHDVAIVGAGPVGATLALALADADLDVVVVDPRAPGEAARADRSLALSHGARLVFERLGIWAGLAATEGAVTPIVTIDVSQARGFGALTLDAQEQGLPALGYVVSYRALQSALDAALRRTRVQMRYGATARSVTGSAAEALIGLEGAPEGPLHARLGVVADGAGSIVAGITRRRRDYGQVALIAAITLSRAHRGIAYERFTPDGPVALLPERDHYALVWTQTPDRAARLLGLSDAEFLGELAAHFGSRAGGFAGVADRRSFALALEVATATTATRVAVIGNAAQALHPIAGQGFNLGLRDAYELAQTILATPREDLGGAAMLERYRRGRGLDRRAGIAFTHGLVQLFGNDLPWLSAPRGVGLMLLDAMPFAKRAFTRAMLFGIH
ncbi:MAG TPA: FAD-dependent oxidoreductase [Casimicrobiaceae bacterium]|nr:FAD-dependent oxidoreductase [Casimicrobiaceae bacterium]